MHIYEDNAVDNWLDEPVAGPMSDPLNQLLAQEDDTFDPNEDEHLELRNQLKQREGFERGNAEYEMHEHRATVISGVYAKTIRILVAKSTMFADALDTLCKMGMNHDDALDALLMAYDKVIEK